MPLQESDCCSSRPPITRVVAWLIGINVAAFFLQLLGDQLTGQRVSQLLGLSASGFLRQWWWQFFTYMFLHGGPLHLFFNMLCLYMMGPELERTLGPRRFLAVYLVSGVVGGIGWLAIQYPYVGYCIGASGAVFGVMAAFATLFPRMPLRVMLFPVVLPLTVPAWALVTVMALIELAFLLDASGGRVAYAAHLAGCLTGFALAWLHRRGFVFSAWLADRRRERATVKEQARREDVDRVLDKLAREGLHTLSDGERRLLERESQRLRRS